MTQDHLTRKEEFPLDEAQHLRAEGKSFQTITDTIGWSFAQTRRKLAAASTNGLPPDDKPVDTTVLAILTSTHPSVPHRISASAPPDALERIHEALARLDTRLHAVEISQQLSARPAHSDALVHPIAPERTEPPTWLGRGMHLATDMAEWIDTYAREQRLEKREVVDLALRTLRGLVASEGTTDA